MDWLEQTTAWLRDWLAQQPWLDAWQPTIAATPDWALLAAAIATPILLWILLRLTWPRRAKATHSAQSKDVAAGGIEFKGPTPVTRAAAPAAPEAAAPRPAAAEVNTTVASGKSDAAMPDAVSDTRQEGEEPDPEFDAILEEIRIACETDPERGLAMIDHYVGVVGEQQFLRFSRVLAYRRILVGSEADARSGRYGHTLDEVARRLSPHKLECGMKALADIAAIEREDPNYFYDGDVKENILDAVCHLMERARPSIVQQTLGWTKLDYFGAGRVSSINENAPGGKEVQRVPEEVKDRVFAVRFKADAIVRSALAMLASGPGSGRGIGFMLFERLPDPNERVIGDRIHVGSVDIGENGDWWYTPKGDGPSMGGGPTYDED